MIQIECPACRGPMRFPSGTRSRVRCAYCRQVFWAGAQDSRTSSASTTANRQRELYDLLAKLGHQSSPSQTSQDSEELIAKTAYACGLVPLAVWPQFRLDRAVLRSLREGQQPRLHPGLIAWHTIRWAAIYTYRATRLLLLVWLTTAVAEQLKRENLG